MKKALFDRSSGKISVSFLVLAIAMMVIFLGGCSYGWDEFFYRKNSVNSRSDRILDLDGTDSAPKTEGRSRYSVVLFSDIHVGGKKNDPDVLIDWMRVQKPLLEQEGFPIEFAVCAGDLTYSGIRSEYKDYAAIGERMEQLAGIRLYSVLGNHDVYNSGWDDYEDLVFPYSSYYRFTTPSGENNLSWYFLDTASGTLGTEQLEDLFYRFKHDSNRKIVVTHFPLLLKSSIYYCLQNIDERDMLIDEFCRNDVKVLLTGHAHIEDGYNYNGYFEEVNLESYIRNYAATILYVDVQNGTFRVRRFHL